MTTFHELVSQDVRLYWGDEAKDFTPWLAGEIDEDHTSHIEDVLGLDLQVIDTERSIGRYNLDILAEVESDNRTVVIENQLAPSDHDHLGKAIAYAAGVDADIIVWIAPRFYDEHIDAAQWLNKHSREGVDIFALKLEVVTIGESEPAVRFTPLAEPSEWTNRVQRPNEDLTETQRVYEQFWTEFRDRIENTQTKLRPRSPSARHYYSNPIGVSGIHISFTTAKSADHLGCVLTIADDATAFEALYAEKEEIESELGTTVEWDHPTETPSGRQRSRIRAVREGSIFVDEDREERWEEYQEWFIQMGERFHDIFGPRISDL
jgi:hypothetical protein